MKKIRSGYYKDFHSMMFFTFVSTAILIIASVAFYFSSTAQYGDSFKNNELIDNPYVVRFNTFAQTYNALSAEDRKALADTLLPYLQFPNVTFKFDIDEHSKSDYAIVAIKETTIPLRTFAFLYSQAHISTPCIAFWIVIATGGTAYFWDELFDLPFRRIWPWLFVLITFPVSTIFFIIYAIGDLHYELRHYLRRHKNRIRHHKNTSTF